jgi:hypothetical protein
MPRRPDGRELDWERFLATLSWGLVALDKTCRVLGRRPDFKHPLEIPTEVFRTVLYCEGGSGQQVRLLWDCLQEAMLPYEVMSALAD